MKKVSEVSHSKMRSESHVEDSSPAAMKGLSDFDCY
jgi:hypothetical protein